MDTKSPRRALVFLIDGFDPAYVRAVDLPCIAGLMKAGAATLDGQGTLPSLTNVNHISLLTGAYPERHGLCANFYYDRRTGREVFMDEATFVLEPLLFERIKALGWSTALVTAKEKLTRLLRRGLDLCIDMTSTPAELRGAVGPAPEIFSMEINLWVLRAAREVAVRYAPDFLYVATTDYPEHKLPPESPEMQRHLRLTDELIGGILGAYDLDRDLVALTADHGMNAKTHSVSPVRLLAQEGIKARGVPLIKDGLYAHHRDLGGALYLFAEDPSASDRAADLLAGAPGVDLVVPRADAGRCHLPPERIGDLVCFGRRDWALGVWTDGAATREEQDLRSHGSLHEQTIPMLLAGPGIRAGGKIQDGRIVDLAPTLCRLLGIGGGSFQGRVLGEVLA
jgi:phosphonoacetate hydrolase